MSNEPRELVSGIDTPTLGKVTPAIEGEVTMQQLLDAMAHMAHDIDVLRAQLAQSAEKSGMALAAAVGLTTEAERIYQETSKHAQRVHDEAIRVVTEHIPAEVKAAARALPSPAMPKVP